MARRVSRKLVKFVASFEGFLGCPYLDTLASPPVWTIGYGYTIGVSRNTPCISKRVARKLLRSTLNKRFVPEIPRRKQLKRQELDALASFAYNVGPAAVNDPGYSTLARRLRSSEGKTFANRRRIYQQELPKWNKAGGVVLAGLVRRRAAEVRMAVNGDYRTT